MTTLDEIPPSTDTVMTYELVRLFRYAGCNPACHACGKKILLGHVFKLHPHQRAPGAQLTDEMLCANCGETELAQRDKKAAIDAAKFARAKKARGASWASGGYSRPSKAVG